MKIVHALKLATDAASREELPGEERAAILALTDFVRQVRAARPAIRRLADLVDPETHLNQQALFDEPSEQEKE